MDEEIKIEGNLDINQALKEFEEKSGQEQSPKIKGIIMPQTPSGIPVPSVPIPKKETEEGIKFDTDVYKTANSSIEPDIPKMIKLVMKWFGLKEQRQAEWILFGFVIIAMGISFYLFFGGSFKKPAPVFPQMLPGMPAVTPP